MKIDWRTGATKMAGHLTEHEIELYRRRQIDRARRQRTDQHLAVCEPCLKRVVNSGHSVLAYNALTEAFLPSVDEESFHLSNAELKRYSAGATSEADRIICESHVEVCNQCSKELRLQSAAYPSRSSQAKERSLGGQFGRRWQDWRLSTPARLAVAIAFLGLLVFAVALWRQRSTVSRLARNGPQETAVPSPGQGSATETTPKPADGADISNRSVLASLKDNSREIRLDQDSKLTGLEGLHESTQAKDKAALAGKSLTKATG